MDKKPEKEKDLTNYKENKIESQILNANRTILRLCIKSAIDITISNNMSIRILPYEVLTDVDNGYCESIFVISLNFFKILNFSEDDLKFLRNEYRDAFYDAYNMFTKEKVRLREFVGSIIPGERESIEDLMKNYYKLQYKLMGDNSKYSISLKDIEKANREILDDKYKIIECIKKDLSLVSSKIYEIKKSNPLNDDNIELYDDIFMSRLVCESYRDMNFRKDNNDKSGPQTPDDIENYLADEIRKSNKSKKSARQYCYENRKIEGEETNNNRDSDEYVTKENGKSEDWGTNYERFLARKNSKRNYSNNNAIERGQLPNLYTSNAAKLCKRFISSFNFNINHLAIFFIIIFCLPKIQVTFGIPWSPNGCSYPTITGTSFNQVDFILGYNDFGCMRFDTPIGQFDMKMEFIGPTNAIVVDEPVFSLDMKENMFNGNASSGSAKHYSCGCLSAPLSLSCTHSKDVNCYGNITDGTLCDVCTIGSATRPDNGCLTLGKKMVLTLIKSNIKFRIKTTWNTGNDMINIYNIRFSLWQIGGLAPVDVKEHYGLTGGELIDLIAVNNNAISRISFSFQNPGPIENFNEVINVYSSNGNYSDINSLYLIPEEEIEAGNPQKFLSLIIDRDGGVDNIDSAFTKQAIGRTISIKCWGNKANQYPYWRSLKEIENPSLNLKLVDNFDIYGVFTDAKGNLLLLFDVPNKISFLLVDTAPVLVTPNVIGVVFEGMICNVLNVYQSGTVCKVSYELIPQVDTNDEISFLISVNGDVKGPFSSYPSQREIYIKVDDNEVSSNNLVCIIIKGTNLKNCGSANITITNTTLDDPNGIFDDGVIDQADDGKEATYISGPNLTLMILLPILGIIALIAIVIVIIKVKRPGYGFKDSYELWKLEMEEKREMKREKKEIEKKKLKERLRGKKDMKPLIDINKTNNKSVKFDSSDISDMDFI